MVVHCCAGSNRRWADARLGADCVAAVVRSPPVSVQVVSPSNEIAAVWLVGRMATEVIGQFHLSVNCSLDPDDDIGRARARAATVDGTYAHEVSAARRRGQKFA